MLTLTFISSSSSLPSWGPRRQRISRFVDLKSFSRLARSVALCFASSPGPTRSCVVEHLGIGGTPCPTACHKSVWSVQLKSTLFEKVDCCEFYPTEGMQVRQVGLYVDCKEHSRRSERSADLDTNWCDGKA